MIRLTCRACKAGLSTVFCDLGSTPLANRFLRADQLKEPEPHFPLCTYVCESCWLVQLPAHEQPAAIFSDYAYFSSYSSSWLAHARDYADMAVTRFGLDSSSRVVEVASNDGYLLQYFARRGVPVFGIEPAKNVASVAREKGVPTESIFLGETTARTLVAKFGTAGLLIANNVLAHVPDINDFVAGLRVLLAGDGVLTIEFPHLLELLRNNQFDTIYHEHYSYLSLHSASRVLASHGLRVFDVETLGTHGGSLRVFVCHDDSVRPTELRVKKLRELEVRAGLQQIETYRRYGTRAARVREDLRALLRGAAARGERMAGYGAPAKGNTLLNYCGITPRELPYTVDASPHKQGLFLPGTHIPILAPAELLTRKPRAVLILPWNIREEILAVLAPARDWGCRFWVAVPEVTELRGDVASGGSGDYGEVTQGGAIDL
ncbi:MAG: class I SAM-dependent methyltransferase [Pseudomonadota bacterium]